jgi:micrococcal nuclease
MLKVSKDEDGYVIDGSMEFRAKAVRVIDGDTCDMLIDVGLGIQRVERIRLLGINTPELKSDNAQERGRALLAAGRLAEILLAGDTLIDWPCRIVTRKADSFGRYLADVYVFEGSGERYVNKILLDGGYATTYKRATRIKKPAKKRA